MMLANNSKLNADLMEIAKASPEQEVCGVIVDGKIVPLENIAENPAESFRFESIPDEAEAVFHSHPGGPFYPTALDMQQQYATGLPWAVACFSTRHEEVFWFGDDVPKPPLIGRGFRHGVTDCYELIRDFYHQVHGINLPHQPRDWEWWDGAERLYADGFQDAGFYPISIDQIEPGDGFLATIRAKTPNHAGIYLGNGLILHHTCGKEGYDPFRLSTVESAARWLGFVTKVLRHEDPSIDRSVGQGIWP